MLVGNQTALVTGAGGGIGRAVAGALAGRGLHVILVGRTVSTLQQTAHHVGGNTTVVAADLTTDDGRALVARHASPKLHVLVHSAGDYVRADVSAASTDQWRAMAAINLHAPLLLTAACLPYLRSALGQVVFINSSAALSATAGLSAYAASKRGLHAAADALRQEVNPDGVRVISVFPGRTDTPMQRAILAAEQRTAPDGTLMQPDDVAAMVIAALELPRTAEVTDIMMRPMRKL